MYNKKQNHRITIHQALSFNRPVKQRAHIQSYMPCT